MKLRSRELMWTTLAQMDWWGEATLSVWPEDDEFSTTWWDHSGTALSVADIDGGGRKLQVLRACGLIVDLWGVENVYDALDARSQDYADSFPCSDSADPSAKPGWPQNSTTCWSRVAVG